MSRFLTSCLSMKGLLISVLFLFFYKNRILSTLLVLTALLIGIEEGRWSPLLKKSLWAKGWFSSEMEE